MKRNAGFSLVEVMVAVLILGVAIVGLTQGISTALVSNKESEVQTVAALIAAGRIEELRAEGILIDGENQGDGTGAMALYRWKETIASSTLDGLHEITIVVENKKTEKPIYELRTMLFDPPTGTNTTSAAGSSSRSNARRGGSAR